MLRYSQALLLLLLLTSPALAQAPRRVHDPSTIVAHDGRYYFFYTGNGVGSAQSKDLLAWQAGPPVFAQAPKWIADAVPGNRGHFWAPDVIRQGDRFLLYYSVSTFGKQTSAIGLASNPVLDPGDPKYRWTDHGIVIRSSPKDNFNAIDPCVFRGEGETLWMAFGSFWSGIKLVQLDPKTGLRLAPDSPVHAIAHKNQIEAPAVVRHGGFYYLMVNWGLCCRGKESTYSIRVGRSRQVTGPYLDRDGVDLLKGGGTLLLGTEGRFIGPGHAGVLEDQSRSLLSHHFYDGERNGIPRLAIRPLAWDPDGWPRVAGKPLTPGE